jgi:hypothetical protein
MMAKIYYHHTPDGKGRPYLDLTSSELQPFACTSLSDLESGKLLALGVLGTSTPHFMSLPCKQLLQYYDTLEPRSASSVHHGAAFVAQSALAFHRSLSPDNPCVAR